MLSLPDTFQRPVSIFFFFVKAKKKEKKQRGMKIKEFIFLYRKNINYFLSISDFFF